MWPHSFPAMKGMNPLLQSHISLTSESHVFSRLFQRVQKGLIWHWYHQTLVILIVLLHPTFSWVWETWSVQIIFVEQELLNHFFHWLTYCEEGTSLFWGGIFKFFYLTFISFHLLLWLLLCHHRASSWIPHFQEDRQDCFCANTMLLGSWDVHIKKRSDYSWNLFLSIPFLFSAEFGWNSIPVLCNQNGQFGKWSLSKQKLCLWAVLPYMIKSLGTGRKNTSSNKHLPSKLE